MSYRPWGMLDFVLGLSSPKDWVFVGGIGTEERSLASWDYLGSLGLHGEHWFYEIQDDPSDYTDYSSQLLIKRRKEFAQMGGNVANIRKFRLLASLHDILKISAEVLKRSSSVILDISSLPKRFFFPLLREFSKCSNLVVTYTSPASYQKDGQLSEQATGWKALPGFPRMRDGKNEMLIASVGFMVEGLIEHARGINNSPSIKVLVPFPATLDAIRRSWESVRQLESGRHALKFENYPISTNDMSLAFDRIVSLTQETDDIPAFAPFGPKPISAAMCLFASQPDRECAVYYPQPLIYHPDYSLGVKEIDGRPAVNAYWINHGGEKLYQL